MLRPGPRLLCATPRWTVRPRVSLPADPSGSRQYAILGAPIRYAAKLLLAAVACPGVEPLLLSIGFETACPWFFCTAVVRRAALAISHTSTCSVSLTTRDFHFSVSLLNRRKCASIFLLGQHESLVLTLRVPIELHTEPVGHVGIELDLCPRMGDVMANCVFQLLLA